jgi:MYXO-CTERM domain-containing protein
MHRSHRLHGPVLTGSRWGRKRPHTPARLHRACAALAGSAVLLCGLGALPHAAPEAEEGAYYLEAGRKVAFERGEAEPGKALRPVLLRHEGRNEPVRAFVDHTAIVTLEPGGESRLAELGGALIRPLMPSAGLWLAEDLTGGDGLDLARRLRGERARGRGIREAIPNLWVKRKAKGAFSPDDPDYGSQWYFDRLHMPEAWGMTQGSDQVTVVVVDTGCDLTHPDLVSKMDPGKDVADGDDDPSPDPAADGAAHGTACAGLVGAATDNKVGMAGACPACRLRCVRLLSDNPVPTSADVDAFQFALDVDAAVVSNSWGYVDPMPVPSALSTAINQVFDTGRGGKGALVLFAMGNDARVVGDDELEAVRGVLGIGAVNNLDQQTQFTNSGNAVDLVAYTGTYSTDITGAAGFDPGDYTSEFGGTSSSCPVAAGIAGLLVSVAPDKTSQELYDLLIATARPAPDATPDANGHDQVFGYGIIDPVAALQTALGITPDAGAGGGGSGGGGGAAPEDKGGCSCEASPHVPAGFFGYALALAALALRRRR